MRIPSTVAAAALLASAAASVQAQEFEKTVPASASGVVEISNVAGTVNVAGWDKNDVEVVAQLEDEDTKVEVTNDGGRTRVRVIVPRRSNRDGEADLQIRVPRASELEISTVSADVNARDITGEQRLKSVSGNIRTDFARGDVEAKTVSGDLWLRGKSEENSLRVSTVSGNVRLDRAAGEVDAYTVSGDMSLDVEPATSVRARTTSGGLDFRGKLAKGASLDAETISGELVVRAQAESGYEFEISSFSGEIENCFKLEPEKASRYGPGSRLSGKRGEGSGKVRLRTMSGDTDLCDR